MDEECRMNHKLARRYPHLLVQPKRWQQQPKRPRMPAIEKEEEKMSIMINQVGSNAIFFFFFALCEMTFEL